VRLPRASTCACAPPALCAPEASTCEHAHAQRAASKPQRESLHLLQLEVRGVGVALGLLDVVGEIAVVAVRLHVARQMSHVKDDMAHCKICVVAVAESGRVWGMRGCAGAALTCA